MSGVHHLIRQRSSSVPDNKATKTTTIITTTAAVATTTTVAPLNVSDAPLSSSNDGMKIITRTTQKQQQQIMSNNNPINREGKRQQQLRPRASTNDKLAAILEVASYDHERAVDRLAVAQFRVKQVAEKREWFIQQSQQQKIQRDVERQQRLQKHTQPKPPNQVSTEND
jgi:hypothetical protein